MANKLDEVIEQFKEANGGKEDAIIRALMAKRDELGEDPSDEDVSKAVQECIVSQLAGALGTNGDNVELTEEDRAFVEVATLQVKELFSSEGWHYSERILRPDLVVYELGFGLQGCNLRMRVHIENNPKVCRIDAYLPITADSTYEYVLCKAIAKENYPRRFGALQYDEKDGEVSYRYSYPITHGVEIDDLKRVFLAVASSAADSYETIRKCCVGKFKSKEINDILNKVNKLVSDLTDEDE